MQQEQKYRPVLGDGDEVEVEEQGVVPTVVPVGDMVDALSRAAAKAKADKEAQVAQVPKQPVKRKRRSCCCC